MAPMPPDTRSPVKSDFSSGILATTTVKGCWAMADVTPVCNGTAGGGAVLADTGAAVTGFGMLMVAS